jgi:PAP_fibrillin
MPRRYVVVRRSAPCVKCPPRPAGIPVSAGLIQQDGDPPDCDAFSLLKEMSHPNLVTCCSLAFATSHERPRAPLLLRAVRTDATRAYAKEYVRRLPSGTSIVERGGWDAVERAAISELAAKNFEVLQDRLPTSNLNVPASGGWSAVMALAADPKGALLNLAKQELAGGESNPSSGGLSLVHLDAIAALLQAQGKGFDSDLVNGEWRFLLQRQANKSPGLQKFVGKREKAGNTQSNFDVKKLQFYTIVSLLKGWLKVVATVQYKPLAENFDVLKKKTIVLRRIACDIIGGYVKLWKLPGLPLPLRVKGGYLDFVYLDGDLRVTRGNRGGLFVHVRPATLQRLLA